MPLVSPSPGWLWAFKAGGVTNLHVEDGVYRQNLNVSGVTLRDTLLMSRTTCSSAKGHLPVSEASSCSISITINISISGITISISISLYE